MWKPLKISRRVPPHAISQREISMSKSRKVDVWLPGEGNPYSHGARPVHLIKDIVDSEQWVFKKELSLDMSCATSNQAGSSDLRKWSRP